MSPAKKKKSKKKKTSISSPSKMKPSVDVANVLAQYQTICEQLKISPIPPLVSSLKTIIKKGKEEENQTKNKDKNLAMNKVNRD